MLVETLVRAAQGARPWPADDVLRELAGSNLVRFASTISELRGRGDGPGLLRCGDAEAAAGRFANALVAFVAAVRVGAEAARPRCLLLGENIERTYLETDPKPTYFARLTPMVLAAECYLEAGVPERVTALERRFRTAMRK